MFDLNDPTLTRVDKNSTPVDRIPDQGGSIEPPTSQKSDLDGDRGQDLHRRLLSYYRQELDRQSENRFQMAVDEDYYDNIQWSEDEAKQLKDRGQAPIKAAASMACPSAAAATSVYFAVHSANTALLASA